MNLRRFAVMLFAVLAVASHLGAAVPLAEGTPPQTFDSIGTSATATLPADFRADRPGTVRTVASYATAGTATTQFGGANLSTTASNGIYNFGSGTTTTGSDRAIGFLSSGSATQSGNLYAQYVNNTGGALSGVRLTYDVEKYRNGTNPQGFRIQLFYSLDGASWTSAGSDFLTSFPADSGANSGFAVAPGVTVNVVDKTLPVTVAAGADLYLAWNYSVSSGTTTTNAQALAIDNISAIGVGAVGSTNPSGTGAASPSTVVQGNSTLLTVSVSPGSNPTSTGITVTGDLSSIGGSSIQAFTDDGGNSFSFNATVSFVATGPKSLPITILDAQGRTGSTSIDLTVEATPPASDHVVISQIYGGGGNSGAVYQNDYMELYNPTASTTFDLTGWSVQYASAAGTSWQVVPIGGTIAPGEYLLVALASGGANGSPLPPANISGDVNMSATTGKVALVSNGEPVSACPSDPEIVDLVGFGAANCREGSANAAGGSNTLAMFRKIAGAQDTNQNGADFETGAPNPRRTAPFAEFGPTVSSTDPRSNATTAPRDASITVEFSEPVDITGNWYDISCASTGSHNDATVAIDGRTWVITPNVNFQAGEQCTVTILAANIHDQDLDDGGPNTDTLPSNHVWSFTVATGTAPAYPSEVHLTMGNPSDAAPFTTEPLNYLMEKPEFALSYHRDRGTPNWVSWHLSDEWVGSLTRVDTFRPDPAVPADWYRVQAFDYSFSGFDRGHMVPNADRDKETSIPINQATFLMSNMIPQTPDNNQGPWADMENDLRALLPANELYIVAGGAGTGGTGSNGFATTVAGGHVTVPAQTWKVVLVLPKADGDDVSRVQASTRTIAVILPNIQGIRNDDWQNYLTTVDAVEALTGYDFFENVSDLMENAIEAGVNGTNPPGVDDQAVSANEDSPREITLQSVSPTGGTVSYTVLSQPSQGTLQGSDDTYTYTPAPEFSGTDSFTFKASENGRDSITATVNITVLEVNDAPAAGDDNQQTSEDTPLSFPAANLTGNDSTGPSNESGQTLTVTGVTATAGTNGTVTLEGGAITYTPAADFNGAASFSYTVCDNGTSGGVSDPQCATATVNVSVAAVNDHPVVAISVPAASPEGTVINATAGVSDADGDTAFTYSWSVTKNGAPYGVGSGAAFSFTPDDNGTYVVSLTVGDGNTGSGTDSESITVTNVNPVAGAVSGPATALTIGSSATITVAYTDAGPADTHTATFDWDDGTTTSAACASGSCTASRAYLAPGVYGVTITIADDDNGTTVTSFQFVRVFDPAKVKVDGKGTIPNGSFDFSVKTDKGAIAPKGHTTFTSGGHTFTAVSYEWMVVAGPRAQYAGSGTIDGSGSYRFILTAIDGDATGGGGMDRYRIRIWDPSTGQTVYDNVPGVSDDIDLASPQAISSGRVRL
jgi:endonuclease G